MRTAGHQDPPRWVHLPTLQLYPKCSETPFFTILDTLFPLIYTPHFILVSTLLHLDKFHFNVTETNPLLAAWAWIIVYVTVPILLLALVILQLRTPGGDPPREAPLTLGLRILLGVNAFIGLGLGLLLFFTPFLSPAPKVLSGFWPWDLTPLTAQTIAIGFLSLGTASIQFIRENAWSRGRVGTVSYMLIGLLQLIAIARYPETFSWTLPGWLYILYMLCIFGGGIYSTIMAWRKGTAASLGVSR